MADTKFKFNDKVRVTKGFYRGIEGVVTASWVQWKNMGMFKDDIPYDRYQFKSDSFPSRKYVHNGNEYTEIDYRQFNEDELELIDE